MTRTYPVNVLDTHKDRLRTKFSMHEPLAYARVSLNPAASMIKQAGYCILDGKRYLYHPADDSMMREDVRDFLVKHCIQQEEGRQP